MNTKLFQSQHAASRSLPLSLLMSPLAAHAAGTSGTALVAPFWAALRASVTGNVPFTIAVVVVVLGAYWLDFLAVGMWWQLLSVRELRLRRLLIILVLGAILVMGQNLLWRYQTEGAMVSSKHSLITAGACDARG